VVDANGRVIRIDPSTQVVVLDNNQAFRPGAAQQTLYGRVSNVDKDEIKIKSDSDDFEVKVPRELAAQLRKGDSVHVDLTFQRAR
jgi:hypothetical protein